jgi:hypothetical protein
MNTCLTTIISVVLIMSSFSLHAEWKQKTSSVDTKWAEQIDPNNVLPEYPRPQMVRSEWINLNGLWEFSVGKSNDKVPVGKTLEREILVPFAVESPISGIMEYHDRLWYRRTFEVSDKWNDQRILMHFGAIDWESEVYINGHSMGIHRGGYDEISYDITDYLVAGAQQEVIVRVYDPTETQGIARGKQESGPHGNLIMYTPVTGIWQTVWLEPVAQLSIKDFKIEPDVDGKRLKLTVNQLGKGKDVTIVARASDGGKTVSTMTGKVGQTLYLPIKKAKLWSPDSPFLYDLSIEMIQGERTTDKVESYFGMRKLSLVQDGEYKKLYLNDEFVYNLGFLDQGFWPDGIYTAPTDEALRFDVQIQKDFGYNMVRKHIKVEPQRWYYWADKLGIMVWQDMPSANSYIHDKKVIKVDQFEHELGRMIETHFNSPSITTWVIYNETQGQKTLDGKNLSQQMYDIVKEKDANRFINIASDNIYKDDLGDILDYHSYPGPRGVRSKTMASACGEFGSIGLAIKGHEWIPNKGASGLMLNTQQELEDTYETYIRMLSEFKWSHGMSGAVFTQLTDVEQEINGFLTYDRVLKVDVAKIKKMNKKLIDRMIVDLKQILPNGDVEAVWWKYTTAKPASGWKGADFEDEAWKSGRAGFGAGAPPHSVINTNWDSDDIWLRKEIEIGKLNAEELDDLLLRVYYDEDFEVYINGVLAVSTKGFTSSYTSLPLSDEAKKAIKVKSKNTIAVHCHQTTGDQFIDIGLIKPIYDEK